MDLTNGLGLASAIASFLNREDLTATIPAFVKMAEARFNRELRTREMIERVTTTTDEQYVPLPSDFLEAHNVQILDPTSYKGVLEYAEPNKIDELRFFPETIRPTHFSIIGANIEFAPVPEGSLTVELNYYQSIPALDATSGASTNWLLTKAPDLYLFGALVASAPFLEEDERIATWATLSGKVIQDLNLEATRSASRGSRLVAKRRTFG
jgi:hypothetical protein